MLQIHRFVPVERSPLARSSMCGLGRIAATLCAFLIVTASMAGAEVFTVGPGGSYSTIQDAIDAAIANGGDHEVRIAQGTYRENLEVFFHPGRLEISGGWQSGFSRRLLDWELTTILAKSENNGVHVECDTGQVEISNLKITRDSAAPIGRGVFGDLGGDCELVIVGSRITGHHALPIENPDAPWGGGIRVIGAPGNTRFELLNSSIDRNRLGDHRYGAGFACGPGAGVSVHITKHTVISGNRIEDNVQDPQRPTFTFCRGAGLDLEAGFGATVHVNDNTIRGNRGGALQRPDGKGTSPNYGTGMALFAFSGSSITARRNRVLDNFGDPTLPGNQVSLSNSPNGDPSIVHFSDSLIAGGSTVGVGAFSPGDEDSVFLNNLTIVDNDGLALKLNDDNWSGVTISNSISYGNGDDTLASSPGIEVAASNWIGVDPAFLYAAGGDYRLRAGSPAVDAGDNSPAGGLGPSDLDRGSRVVGSKVDIGAFERQPGLSCSVRGVSVPEVRASATACRCFQDFIGGEARCAFNLHDWLLVQRLPLVIPPLESFKIEYQVLTPNPTVMTLAAFQLIDGGQQPLGKGPVYGKVPADQLWLATVSGIGPKKPGLYPIQTVVEYEVPGALDEQGSPSKAKVLLEVSANAQSP